MRASALPIRVGLTSIAFAMTACYVSVDDDEDEETEEPPPSNGGGFHNHPNDEVECEVASYYWTRSGDYSFDDRTLYCYEKDRETRLSICSDHDLCRRVEVNVNYMLTDDIGRDRVVIVEAFNNAQFAGAPTSSSVLTGFDASRAGTHDAVSLDMPEGDYYFRAYITNANETTAPYEYAGMHLVSDRPVGTYGAASSAVHVDLNPHGDSAPNSSIQIYLDKLFKKDGEGEDTRAHIRFVLTVADAVTIEPARKAKVQLFTDEDFAFDPAYTFDVASENFLVDGHQRHAEFVTPDLRLGRYFVRVFLDSNGNGFRDDQEAEAVYQVGGVKGIVDIKAKRTETLALTLQIPAAPH